MWNAWINKQYMQKFASCNSLFLLDHAAPFSNLTSFLVRISMNIIMVNIFWEYLITERQRTGTCESTDKVNTTEFGGLVQTFSAVVTSYNYGSYKEVRCHSQKIFCGNNIVMWMV